MTAGDPGGSLRQLEIKVGRLCAQQTFYQRLAVRVIQQALIDLRAGTRDEQHDAAEFLLRRTDRGALLWFTLAGLPLESFREQLSDMAHEEAIT